MKKERLRSTVTQSLFAVPDPEENIHEQACTRTRHRSRSGLEHRGVRPDFYPPPQRHSVQRSHSRRLRSRPSIRRRMPRSTSRSVITLAIMPPTKARRSWSNTRLQLSRLRRKPLREIRLSTRKWPQLYGAIFLARICTGSWRSQTWAGRGQQTRQMTGVIAQRRLASAEAGRSSAPSCS